MGFCLLGKDTARTPDEQEKKGHSPSRDCSYRSTQSSHTSLPSLAVTFWHPQVMTVPQFLHDGKAGIGSIFMCGGRGTSTTGLRLCWCMRIVCFLTYRFIACLSLSIRNSVTMSDAISDSTRPMSTLTVWLICSNLDPSVVGLTSW